MDFERKLQSFLVYSSANKGLSLKTVESYEDDLKKFCEFFLSRDLTDSNLFEYVNSIKSQFKPTSVNRKLSSLRAFLKFVFKDSIPVKLENLQNLKTQIPIERQVDYETLKELFCDSRNGLILLFFYATGLRVSELINLKISDIYFDAGLIRFIGKGDKVRIIPVSLEVLQKIKTYIDTYRGAYQNQYSKDYLFLSKLGKPFTRAGIWKIIKQTSLKKGLNLHPHSLRHLFATHLLENGANIKIIKELLGHSSITTTMRYTLVSDGALNKAFKEADTFGET